jgi:hypothetical protein
MAIRVAHQRGGRGFYVGGRGKDKEVVMVEETILRDKENKVLMDGTEDMTKSSIQLQYYIILCRILLLG